MTEACWSFPTTNTDHAETPIEAYEDVVPVLDFLCTLLHRTRATLRIWDPFFCHGTMVQRLAELGFTSVTNENEDAYHVIAEKREPEHDVLLTNPPFRLSTTLCLFFCVRVFRFLRQRQCFLLRFGVL